MSDVLRTDDARFDGLPGWPYAPRYLEGLLERAPARLHYVDEGPRDASRVALCLHGQPTWSYLYRKMIPVFVEAGLRVVAPDLVGFGRSDKPTAETFYTFEMHRTTLARLVERLDLRRITLVCQDWGGILGLTLPMEEPSRWERLLVMNTAVVDGRTPPGRGFLEWKAYAAAHPDLDIAALMRRAVPGITDEEAEAYAAPFPDARHKAGVRRFPELVPIEPTMPGAETGARAARWLHESWDGPSFMAVGLQDPVLGPPVMARMRALIRGCPPPLELPEAGHFVQEHGERVARAALEHFAGR